MKNNDQLAKVIAQGKWRFILVRGVLVFGLVSASLASILTFLFKSEPSTWDFVRPFIFFPPAGVLWGAFMWSWMKRRLEASQNANADGGEPRVHLSKRLGNLEFVERTDYEQKELGYSLRYQTKDLLKADVYVYDLGIRNLPDGITSPEIRKEMENGKGDLREVEKMGKYKNVKELGNGERKFENLNTRFLWTRFSYEQSAGEGVTFTGARISESFLLAHRGHFLKVRITTKRDDWAKHEPQIDQFMRAIAQQLEKGEPDGATNGSQPIRSETNRTSSADGSRR